MHIHSLWWCLCSSVYNCSWWRNCWKWRCVSVEWCEKCTCIEMVSCWKWYCNNSCGRSWMESRLSSSTTFLGWWLLSRLSTSRDWREYCSLRLCPSQPSNCSLSRHPSCSLSTTATLSSSSTSPLRPKYSI